MEALRRSLERRSEYNVEYRLVTPDGSPCWISTVGCATFDSENRRVRVMGVSIDVTASKLAELQLFQQRDELAHLSRVTTIGEMATTLAHELNQPILAKAALINLVFMDLRLTLTNEPMSVRSSVI